MRFTVVIALVVALWCTLVGCRQITHVTPDQAGGPGAGRSERNH